MRSCLILTSLAILLLTSCVPHRDLVSFNEAPLPIGQTEEIANALELKIQPNDLLRIEVQSIDPEAALPFNQMTTGEGLAQMSAENRQLFRGYLVDQDGFIDFPVVGRIGVEGRTLESLQEFIRTELQTYLKSPVVNARFLNLKVTVLGEVAQPGVVSLLNSRVTILEAIGLAGDLSDYANRSNILIVREEDGKRSYERLNLQADDVFTSPYYYLQQNDLIYIEPIRARTATVADPGQRIVSYGTAVLSLAALILTLTRN
ncbi:MAG: polysaccharide biosynthesis/export family protein [Bacteroidota bacterium]